MKKEREVLSVNEREGLKREKKDLENTLRAMEGGEYGQGTRATGADQAALKRQIKRIGTAIKRGTPNITGADKDKAYRRAKELEEKFSKGMCSYDEMMAPEKHPGAVRKNYEWHKRNAKAVSEWKRIRRMLEPHDPTSSNIERLRRRR